MHGRSPLQHRCTNKEVYFFMNNLTTRKIVLGMLMALVLTFSVQGIADALTFTQPAAGTKRTGDLQTLKPGDEFVITFSLTLNPSAEVNTGTQLGNSSITDYTATAPYFYLSDPTIPNSRVLVGVRPLLTISTSRLLRLIPLA